MQLLRAISSWLWPDTDPTLAQHPAPCAAGSPAASVRVSGCSLTLARTLTLILSPARQAAQRRLAALADGPYTSANPDTNPEPCAAGSPAARSGGRTACARS